MNHILPLNPDSPPAFADPSCPEHPTFPEKLALALAAGKNARRSGDHAHEHFAKVEQSAHEILRTLNGQSTKGRTPVSDLEVFFLAFRSDKGTGQIIPTPDRGPPPSGYGDIAASNALGDTAEGALGAGVPATALDTRLKKAAASLGIRLSESTLDRLRLKWSIGEYQDYLIRLDQAYETERAMLDSLLAIQAELARWNIPMEVDVIRLRLASLWSIVPKA